MFSNLFNKKKEKPKKIISFDGGGVRVIAGIVFLKKLEAEKVKLDPQKNNRIKIRISR